jgi:beta-galactosidase
LTLNGQAVGTRQLSAAEHGVLRWTLPYQPGVLQAVGSADGHELCRYTLQTAGVPARVALVPDVASLHANGKDVCQLEFRILDAQGLPVPDASPTVSFSLAGPGKILGLGNADVDSVEDCKSNTHHAFQGRGLAILQTTTVPGDIMITATSPGLAPANVTLPSR